MAGVSLVSGRQVDSRVELLDGRNFILWVTPASLVARTCILPFHCCLSFVFYICLCNYSLVTRLYGFQNLGTPFTFIVFQ
jgi:hypothetical protein